MIFKNNVINEKKIEISTHAIDIKAYEMIDTFYKTECIFKVFENNTDKNNIFVVPRYINEKWFDFYMITRPFNYEINF